MSIDALMKHHNLLMICDVTEHISPSNPAEEGLINYFHFFKQSGYRSGSQTLIAVSEVWQWPSHDEQVTRVKFRVLYVHALSLSLRVVARVLKHYITLHYITLHYIIYLFIYITLHYHGIL